MTRETALSGRHLDWDRTLCKQGCKEWIPWYQNKRGKQVHGCQLGLIPQRVNGQWYCRQLMTTKQKGAEDRA